MSVHPNLTVLACPDCHCDLRQQDAILTCVVCKVDFPIVNGRPVLVSSKKHSDALYDEILIAAKELREYSLKPKTDNLQWDKVKFFKRVQPGLPSWHPEWKSLQQNICKAATGIHPTDTVVDIGCGDCRYQQMFSHCQYLGIDLVASSNAHNFSEIDVIADAQELPIRSNSVDVVLNLVVLEHVPNPQKTMAEIARILKPNGKAYCLVPLVRPEHLAPFDFYRFTQYAIKQMANKEGLGIELLHPSNGALWTGVRYAYQYMATTPLTKWGRRHPIGLFQSILCRILLYPLLWYAALTDRGYSKDFPLYYWATLVKNQPKTNESTPQ